MKHNLSKWGILTGIMLCVWMSSFAQRGKIRRADSFYEEQVYVKALHLYGKAYPRARSNNGLLRRMADAAYRVGENESALKFYKWLIARKAAEPADILTYANALKKDGNYKEAVYWLAEYKKVRNDSLGLKLELQLAYMKELMRDSLRFKVQPVNVNTHRVELGPVVYGDSLVFCSAGRRSGPRRKSYFDQEPYLKLFAAEILPDGQLGKPKVFAPSIRSKYHDGPLTIAQSAGTLFVTQNQKPQGINFRFDNFVQLKIQQAVWQNGQWQPTGDFPFNGKKYSVAHPAINADGTVLVFASNKAGGYGRGDLYISYFTNGSWSEPKNLGPEINTSGSELFPYLANDNMLYFASDGLEGLGGLDLFKAELVDGQVRNVTNLGAPINSSGDDFSITFTDFGNKGYFASNRHVNRNDDFYSIATSRQAYRNDDLYYFERKGKFAPEPLIVMEEGSEPDMEMANKTATGTELLPVTIKSGVSDDMARSETTEGEVKSVQILAEEVSKLRLEPGGQPTITYQVPDEHNNEMITSKTKGGVADPLFMDMENGEPIQILEVYNIHYDLAKYDIGEDACTILDSLVDLLSRNPDLEVRIESHADCRGSREANNVLTEKRARIINNYLVSRYISSDRIQYKGFGESRLLNVCVDGEDCTEEEHAVNRRSVIKIIRKGVHASIRLKRTAFYF